MFCLCVPLYVIKGRKWKFPREFEENPRTMNFKDLIYFTYKYYFISSVNLPHGLAFEYNNPASFESELKGEKATISIGGDLMPYEMIVPENTSELWSEIGDDFFGSDIVFANLETPLDVSKAPSFVPEVMLNHMLFNTNLKTFEVFSGNGRYKGFQVLSVANNHSLDKGVNGIDSTKDFLESNGISTVGAKKFPEDLPFVIKEVKGIKIGFIAYTYSLNQFECPVDFPDKVNLLALNVDGCDISMIVEHAKLCREAGADLIICSAHCGNAYQAFPSKVTIELFERIFKSATIDIIAGGHPHNLQPWKYYKAADPVSGKMRKCFAIFSLADFIAYDIYTWCHLCAYLKIEIGKTEIGEVDYNVKVNPLVMERNGNQLKLKYAEAYFSQVQQNSEWHDLKVLYDLCTKQSVQQ